MALNQEMWAKTAQELLWNNNEFYQFAMDATEYIVSGTKTVHIPNIAGVPTVTKDRSSFPASYVQETDTEITFDMGTYDIAPRFLNITGDQELSYDKRSMIMNKSIEAIKAAVAKDTIYNWSYNLPSASKVASTGSSRTASLSFATGNRKAYTYADIVKLIQVLDTQNVPQTGRKMLVSAAGLADIRGFLVSYYSDPIVTSAISKGAIGTLLGCDVYVRASFENYFNATGSTLEVSQSTGTTMSDYILVWHPDMVAKAFGTVDGGGVKVVINENDPGYFGASWSLWARGGSSRLRYDKYGVALLYETIA